MKKPALAQNQIDRARALVGKLAALGLADHDAPKTGLCACGCEQATKGGYFAIGHDHRAQGFLVARLFGSTAALATACAALMPKGGVPAAKSADAKRQRTLKVVAAVHEDPVFFGEKGDEMHKSAIARSLSQHLDEAVFAEDPRLTDDLCQAYADTGDWATLLEGRPGFERAQEQKPAPKRATAANKAVVAKKRGAAKKAVAKSVPAKRRGGR